MSQYNPQPIHADVCVGAVGQFLRVKTPGAVDVAGALDQSFGTAFEATFAAGEISVMLKNAQGSQKMVAAGAITKGAYVYGAASGKVSAVANGNIEGIAKETVTADGDIIEVQPINQTVQNGVTLAAASGAIALVPGTVVITKTGSLAAMTLAAPTAAQNGLMLTVTSATAFAHTITATSLIEDGVTGGAKTTATFAAFAGATIVLVAYNLKWHTVALKAVTVA